MEGDTFEGMTVLEIGPHSLVLRRRTDDPFTLEPYQLETLELEESKPDGDSQ